MRKKTHEEFINQIKNINPNIKIISQYKRTNDYVECECIKCGHTWSAFPHNLLKGHGCPLCSKKKNSDTKSKSNDEFISELKEVNKYIIPLDKYVRNNIKIRCVCSICGYEYMVVPSSLLNGYGCPRCSKKERYTTETFIEKLRTINPNIEILDGYKNSFTKVKCRCKECGNEWNARPGNLLFGTGCPVCSGVAKYTTDSFAEKLFEINNNIEIIGEYKNMDTKIAYRCKSCDNINEASPRNLLHNLRGCPYCASSKGEKRIREFLNDNNIEYIAQYRFDDCKDIYTLPFDFFIPNCSIVIEYDGIQHFETVDLWGGENALADTQRRDKIKTDYCKNHNIRLIRISYKDFDNINSILDNELLLNEEVC